MSWIKQQKLKKKGSTAFYYYWRNDLGKEKSEKLPASNRREADKLKKLRDTRRYLIKHGIVQEYSEIRLDDFWSRCLPIVAANKASSTVMRDIQSIKPFRKYLGNIHLLDISPEIIENYRVARLMGGIKKSTSNIEMRHLKAIFTFAVKWDYLPQNPFKEVKLYSLKKENRKKEKLKPKLLTAEQVKRFLEVIYSPRDSALFHCYLYTGARLNDVLQLTWDDIDESKNIIWIYSHKNDELIELPLHPKLKRLLFNLPSNGKEIFNIGKSWTTRLMKIYLNDAQLPMHFTTKSLRHTVMTDIDRRLNNKMAKRVAGHRNLATTEIYIHRNPAELKEAILGLPW